MIDFGQLAKPFGVDEVEWRLQSCGKTKAGSLWARALAYLTNRAIMDRLDDVCGPENWKNSFSVAPGGGVLCGIAIKCGDEWVAKYDGAENTDIEKVKGGLSGSMKRAAVQWGIGRYLYGLESGKARTVPDKYADGAKYGKTKDGTEFGWFPPALPSWALPEGVSGAPKEPQESDQERHVTPDSASNYSPEPQQQTQRPDNGRPSEAITDAQRTKLHAAFGALGYDEEKRHEYLSENYGGRTSFNDLGKSEASALIELMAGATTA